VNDHSEDRGPADGEPDAAEPDAGAEEHGTPPAVVSRRSFIAAGALAAAGAALPRLPRGPRRGGLSPESGRLLERAVNLDPSTSKGLAEIEHVVILMQENRSFDHYFGTLSGVRGYSDPNVATQTVGGVTYPVFDQFGYEPGVGPTPNGYLQPFHLLSRPPKKDGETTNDITHSWGPQHQCWNGGAMDQFLPVHLANDGDSNGFVTMGYFTDADLAFYHAVADAFTICDGYYCSVLGPTDPNRLMWISATIDPAGIAGGPVLETFTNRASEYGTLSWTTMPEQLTQAGVSWKVYNDPVSLLELSPFPYFRQYWTPSTPTEAHNASLALTPTYPASFAADVASGDLPSVSWIVPPLAECEHPAAPPEYGEYLVNQVLATLVSNPDIWASTVLFVTYDENGGFFDHLQPVTAPGGTDGEYVTASPLPSAASGIAGPIGLGFRVPCLVLSPFSRGGWFSSSTFDHTSLLRFLETRFGVVVPNLTPWRRSVTGDLTETLRFGQPDVSLPELPATSLGDTAVAEQAVINALAGTEDVGVPYPAPRKNVMPRQMSRPRRRRIP
jgi:phospholipase C